MDSHPNRSNPRPFAKAVSQIDEDDIRLLAKKDALRKLKDASHNADLDLEETCIQVSVQNIERPKLFKPIFIDTSRLAKLGAKYDEDDAIDCAQNAKQLLRAVLDSDIHESQRSFEEKRIAGTPFDIDSIDDTDGLDDEEELIKWQEREVMRIKWERSERGKWKEDAVDRERRKHMTEEDKQIQDLEKLKEWQEHSPGEYKFLQKYYHKGAFYQDPVDPLQRRNYAIATGAEGGVDKDTLPTVLQVRNFGRKGRSKWTHLTAEDTTSFEYGWGDKKNPANFQNIDKMGGMRGDLDNPGKRYKQ